MPIFAAHKSLKHKWRSLPIQRRGAIALFTPLLCLIAAVGAGSWLRQNVIQSEQYVERSQQVLLTSQKVLISLLNAQTGAGGYYVTGEERFLVNYRLSLIELPGSLDQLKQLVQENPAQLKRAIQISKLAQENITIRQEGVKYIDANPNTPSPSQLKDFVIQGKLKMDQVRIVIDQLEQEVRQTLVIQKATFESQWQINTVIIWISLIFSILGTAIAMRIFSNLIEDLGVRAQHLVENKNLTQAIVANVIDSVVILDRQNQIESFNDSAIRMFSYELEEVIGHDWSILLPETPDSISKIYAQNQAEATKTSLPWQTMGSDKFGKTFPVEVSISDISFEHRRVLIIRDISERQQVAAKLEARANELSQLNQDLNDTNWLLEERNSDLDQFAYIVSHDLKAPLRAIANLSEWIEEDLGAQFPDQTETQMRLLRQRVQRMDALLDGLLEFARVGRISSQVESINVAELITEVIETLIPPANFKIEIADNMPTLQGRRILLKQVFSNLIDNAIKHHPNNIPTKMASNAENVTTADSLAAKSGLLKISVIDQSDRYQFIVADNGKGIDPKFHLKVFEVFQTLQPRDQIESTGIGLAIVKKIVETEGGTIELDSQPGEGATFRFSWLKSAI